MRYLNTAATSLIAEYPRATYRVTITRRPFVRRGLIEQLTPWTSIVRTVLENSASVGASPLTPDGTVTNDDTVAVLDYRATAHPGIATVGDVVDAIERSTDAIDVVSIERNPPVPRLSDGGAGSLDASRRAAQDAAQADADAVPSWLERATGGAISAAKGLRTLFVAGAVIAVAVAALVYLPKPRK